MRAYTQGGGAHRQRVSTTFLTEKLRDSNLWSGNPLDLEVDALPIEPPRQYVFKLKHQTHKASPQLFVYLHEVGMNE